MITLAGRFPAWTQNVPRPSADPRLRGRRAHRAHDLPQTHIRSFACRGSWPEHDRMVPKGMTQGYRLGEHAHRSRGRIRRLQRNRDGMPAGDLGWQANYPTRF